MHEVGKFFFANFQILGPLGYQGWVVIPQNVKKSQNHCTLSVCTLSKTKDLNRLKKSQPPSNYPTRFFAAFCSNYNLIASYETLFHMGASVTYHKNLIRPI
jgi:hypothetical protein